MKMKSIFAALAGMSIAAAALPASANTLITNWQFGTGAALNTGVNQLNFNGESYVVNTLLGTGPGGLNVSSTDYGVFNFTTKNIGTLLNVGGGQFTAVFNATDFGNLSTGTFHFTGGTLDIYYNTVQAFGTTSANAYGAATGTMIGSFAISNLADPTRNGGFINPNGTPTANGQITVTATATSLLAPYWMLNGGVNPIMPVITLGFVTSNAAEDPSANANSYTIDPNLVTALGAPAGQTNVLPTNIFVSNGGQLKLEKVPEPGSLALLGIGILGLGLTGMKRRAS